MTPEAVAALPYRPCVGVMLINPGGLIFAARRLDTDLPAWQMPQGGIDPGEEPETAALRELHEETSIPPEAVTMLAETRDWLRYDIPPQMVPTIWGGKFRGQRQRWYLMRFDGQDTQIDLETAHPEFSAWRWMAADDLLDSIVPFKRATYARVIDEFRNWLA